MLQSILGGCRCIRARVRARTDVPSFPSLGFEPRLRASRTLGRVAACVLFVLCGSSSLVLRGALAAEPGESGDDALDRALRKPAEAPGTVTTPRSQDPLHPQEPLDPLDRALSRTPEPMRPSEAPSRDLFSQRMGSVNLRLIDLSFDGLFAAGSSTATDEVLQTLQGGGHDPRKRGFTVQNVELSLAGAVDPYFNGEAHIIYFLDPISGESQFELEEAFFKTQALPWYFQLKGGQYLTEFGRINGQHPHAWDWLDQPVVNTRFFGPDGMRGPGVRLAWLSPLPWSSELIAGVQNANGETMSSFLASEEFFEERPIAGRPFVARDVKTLKDLAYSLRWDNSPNITDEISSQAGLSFAYGPNATGRRGYTRIYGADLIVKYRPLANDHGWPFLIWQSEIMKRDYFADSADNPAPPPDAFDSTLFRDWGFYTQLLWGFVRNWGVGFRTEFAAPETGSGDLPDGETDPFRDRRLRLSPLVLWQPTEFSRIRLQYNYDRSDFLENDEAHSVWCGFEFMFGNHPAHKY